MSAVWRKIKIGLAIGVATLTCPCHLALTIPILISISAGTSFGVMVAKAPLLFILLSIGLFGGSTFLVFRWLGSSKKAATCKNTNLVLKKKGKCLSG